MGGGALFPRRFAPAQRRPGDRAHGTRLEPPASLVRAMAAGGRRRVCALPGVRRFQDVADLESHSRAAAAIRRPEPSPSATVNLLNPNPWISWSLVLGRCWLKGWREAPSPRHRLAGWILWRPGSWPGIHDRAFRNGRETRLRISRILIGLSAAALAVFGVYLLCPGVRDRIDV